MGSEEYSVVIDQEEYIVHLEEENGAVYVKGPEDGERVRAEVDELDAGVFRLRMGERQETFGRVRKDKEEQIYLNGSSIEADVCRTRFREEDIVPEQARGKGDLYAITASIPGQVLDISVEEGDELNIGQTVLLLSAMKLENEIQTDEPGIVEKIHVRKDDTVEKGQVLMEIRS